MLLSRKLDDKEIQLKNQSQIFFQISGAGHEAMLVAAGLTLRPGYDWFFPYYRDRALCLQLGVTPLEMLLAAVGAKDDPSSGGRQMPSHWGHTALNIVSRLEPDRHAGAARGRRRRSGRHLQPRRRTFRIASARFHADEITYVSLGEGATSEGEFWEALNTACTQAAAGALPGRGQRLRDLGAGRSPDRRAATSRGSCARSPACTSIRSTAPTSSPACGRCARPTAYVARAQGAGVRPRARHPARTRTRCRTTRSCTSRRRSARPKRARDPIARFAEFLQDERARHRRRARGHRAPTSSAR